MKRVFFTVLIMLSVMLMGGFAYAGTIQTTVYGNAFPWNSSDPNYPFFVSGGGGIGPTVVNGSSGLPMTVGTSLTISYLSGYFTDGGGGYVMDANGANGQPRAGGGTNPSWGGDWHGLPWISDSYGAWPGYYVASGLAGSVYLDELMGVFTNNAGVTVSTPFVIGNGPVTVVIPSGATQLDLGVDDYAMFDNGGSVVVNIAETSAVPAPMALLLFAPGLAGLAAVKRRFKK